MITILHGEHEPKSRQRLVELLTVAKNKQSSVERVEAKQLTLPMLEALTAQGDLFGSNRLVVIEGLHSLPKSKKQTEFIQYITGAGTDIILWEKRTLTKTMLAQFPQARVEEFKLSKSLFGWLDSLNGSSADRTRQLRLLHQVLAQEDAFFCLVMLARQIRLLIQTKDGETLKGPPFMIAKLNKQAASFNLAQLLKLHAKITEIDLKQKTSSSQLELTQELDLLLATM